MSIAYQGEKLFGSKTQHVGQYDSTLSTQQASMAKAVQAYTEAGWKFVNCPFLVNYNGEANYTPFMQKLQSCGAQIVFDDATPGPTLYGALQAENQIGYNPIWLLDAAEYTEGFAQVEHQRSGQQRLRPHRLRAARGGQGRPGRRAVPLRREEVRRPHVGPGRAVHVLVPALGHRGQGVRLDPHPPVHDQPPVQGDELDRRRANAPSDPAKNLPAPCGILHEARTTPSGCRTTRRSSGTFDCSPKYVVPNSGSVIGTTLNAQGYATQYATSSVIKPQG